LFEEDGRFELHPMVSQMAAERLEADADDFEETRQRHAEFFTRRMKVLEEKSSNAQMEAACELHKDVDNLRLAWEWGVEHANRRAIEDGMAGLARFYDLRNLPEEGEAAFQAAVTATQPLAALENPGGEKQALLAKLYVYLDQFQLQLGKSEAGNAFIHDASQPGGKASDS
jgi:hypothetical protein